MDSSRQNTLNLTRNIQGNWALSGIVYCYRNVIFEVEKEYHSRHVGRAGILQVRCFRYLYVGWIRGGHLALKYHNHHANLDEYIHRVYNPTTGQQTLYETLHRHQFPLFSEVLDELELVTRPLAG